MTAKIVIVVLCQVRPIVVLLVYPLSHSHLCANLSILKIVKESDDRTPTRQ